MIAALGPEMLRLAGDATEGAIPYLVTPDHTAFARETMGDDAFLVVEQAVVLGTDSDRYRTLASTHLATYTGLPNYVNNWRRLGFDDNDFDRGGSHRLQDALVAHGDEEAIWARVDEHFAAGADHVCIQILGSDFLSPPFDDWRRLSPTAAGR
jgi:probable F420-dependent oxidoreductase